MYMLQYWSFWNFNWWLLSQINLIKLDYALATSIIGTSLMGGFIIHVYPRKLKITYNNKRIIIPYKYSFWIDIITHQLPLYVLYKQHTQIHNRCGKYIVLPIAVYSLTNYINKTPLEKTYGLPTSYLYFTGYGIISTIGNIYHSRRNSLQT